ncbi:MAG: lipid-transfer protein [Burkholderiales bacterium]|nr:lipid-transfer protein [Burkholderiales bacterium]
MSHQVFVSGVGMIPFTKPSATAPYDEMGAAAARMALADAGIDYADIQQAYVGYVYGDSTSGQKALYKVGMTGIPVFNVNNNCSTGSTALFLARQAIASGALDCVLVLGFEQMRAGALGSIFQDRPSPFDAFDAVTDQLVGMPQIPLALRYFGGAGLAHMQKYGTPLDAFAKIRAKASQHAANNPLAVFKQVVSAEEVLNSTMIWPGVMTKLMACPPTCGAAAAVLVSASFAKARGLVGYDMSKAAAAQVYRQAGIGPEDLDVVELHDCFAHNELITYEALGLCPEGGADKFICDADNTYGGQVVTNPSGGLLSKGHPLGATGLAQCFELTHQLRGSAGARQVAGAQVALQHNLGLGGACVVTMYRAS